MFSNIFRLPNTLLGALKTRKSIPRNLRLFRISLLAMAGLLTRRPKHGRLPDNSAVASCPSSVKGAAHSSGTVQDSHSGSLLIARGANRLRISVIHIRLCKDRQIKTMCK